MAEPTNSMAALMQILSLFQGKNQTEETSGTTTTKTTSQEGLNAMLKQALESNQGLASVMGGEKAAGLYNSSTNALLSNDLATRMAGQVAAQNSVTTTSPSTRTMTTPAAINSKNAPMLAGVLGGGTALNKIMAALNTDEGKLASVALKAGTSKEGRGLLEKGYDAASDWLGSIGDMGTQTEAIGNIGSNLGEMTAPIFSNEAAVQSIGQALSPTGADFMLQDSAPQFQSLMNAMQGIDLSSATEAAAPVIESAVDTGSALVGEAAGNFPTASANGTTTSTLAPSSSGNVESVAEAAPSTVINSLTTDSASTGASSFSDAGLSPDLATDAIPADYGSDLVDSSVSLDQLDLGVGTESVDFTSAYNAADGTSSVTAADLGGSYTGIGSAGSGSILGYVGPIMSALNAPQNTKGEQGTDYRNAVGGAVLNYFGLGFLTPLANATATPLLDEVGDAGYKALGNAGIVASDPVGALISGRMDFGDVVTSGLDPGNILGGNEGGSVGQFVGMTVDPVGAALGGEGLFGAVSNVTNSIDSAISPGRVVCTELAFAGLLPMEKYREVIKPDVTLTGRILLGYHVLGVPAVRRLRSNPKFAMRALPYVNAYLDHKLGHWNLTGFIIKSIGEPLCWLLSFVNTDPDYYKTLYPYRRNRNGT